MKKEEIKKIIKTEDIKFVQLWFTDLFGSLKSFTITPKELYGSLEEGIGFDGSSISGFTSIEESDLTIMPDVETFRIASWKDDDRKTAIMFCDILNPDYSPYENCPRYVLKKALKKATEKGYSFFVGPELEYFYLRKDVTEEGYFGFDSTDSAGYFSNVPEDEYEDVREETVLALQEMGIEVECLHHEVAPSQHEISMRFDDALIMADKVMMYKVIVKEIARQHGLHATFMPKPISGENGSGMHTHQSLFKGDKNIFFDKKDSSFLSKEAKHYIAGIIDHAPAITAICNQWVNSYKRLVPGYEAPVYMAWARRNRSAMIRVPAYRQGSEKATRIELRSPDPSCNPYLAFAVMLSSGLEGIDSKKAEIKPVEENIYKMDDATKKKYGIKSLPENLKEALGALKKDSFIKDVLGDHIFGKFIDAKQEEWDEYRMHVGEFEHEKYLKL